MKEIFIIFCVAAVLVTLVACGGNKENTSLSQAQSSLSQVQSSFSQAHSSSSQAYSSSVSTKTDEQDNTNRQIQLTTQDGKVIVFALNNSTAASNLYNQLPIPIEIENYGSTEKIFYPPENLNTHDAPLAKGPIGTLAYYEPWGNVVIYFEDCEGASGLYELGNCISGAQYISQMEGEIKIETVEESLTPSQTVRNQNGTFAPTQAKDEAKTPSSEIELTPEKIQASDNTILKDNTVNNINVQVGDKAFTATLEGNSAAQAFVEMIKSEPLTIAMSDYSGFEKMGYLKSDLPTSNIQTTTQSGDIVLYNKNQIVVFYGSNSWSYTRLGKIDDLYGWENALGDGDINITFSAS